ncbi:MAG: hypothetical protein ABL890_01915 [Candidatus Peribacteraceae bacterium]
MKSFFHASAKEKRLLNMKVTENLGKVADDTLNRYLVSPVESGHPERLLLGIPLAIINGSQRAIDAVFAGVADQEIDIPDGTFAETRRDAKLIPGHVLPPRPLKLATDIIRAPGTLTTGGLDAITGFTRRRVESLSLSA